LGSADELRQTALSTPEKVQTRGTSDRGTSDRLIDVSLRSIGVSEEAVAVAGALASEFVARTKAELEIEAAYKRVAEAFDMSTKDLERAVAIRRMQSRGGGFPGVVDIKNYPLFAYRAGAAEAVAPYLLTFIYATPIVGEAIGLVDAVTGRSFFTGEKLATWERVLIIALLAIPDAQGIWGGLKGVARGTLVKVAPRFASTVVQIALTTDRSVEAAIRLVRRVAQLRRARIEEALVETGRVRKALDMGRVVELSPAHGKTTSELAHAVGVGAEQPAGGASGATGTRIPGFEPTPHSPTPDVVPGKLRSLEPTAHPRTRDVKPGTLEGLEPTASQPTRRPRTRETTREEQLYGIPRQTGVRVPRTVLRVSSPTKEIREWAQRQLPVGTADPVFPGRVVTGPAQADHIVPLDQIRKMPGFAQLTEKRQIEILNWQRNFEPLSPYANSSKGNRSFRAWARELRRRGDPINAEYLGDMIKAESKLAMEIQDRIGDFLRQQWNEQRLIGGSTRGI
jgi:hypothetical protein